MERRRDAHAPGYHIEHNIPWASSRWTLLGERDSRGFVFISGQLPITPHGEKKAGASFEEQTRQVLENVDACLKGAGVSRQHLVSVRVYVTDINQWPTFNDIYAEWIGDFRPSRVVAGVAELHYGSALEVEALALAQ